MEGRQAGVLEGLMEAMLTGIFAIALVIFMFLIHIARKIDKLLTDIRDWRKHP